MEKLRPREVKTMPNVTQQDWPPMVAPGTQVGDLFVADFPGSGNQRRPCQWAKRTATSQELRTSPGAAPGLDGSRLSNFYYL